MQSAEKISFEKLTARQLQLGCLTVFGLICFATLLLGSSMSLPMQQFTVMCMNLTGAMFLGASLREPKARSGKNLLLLGLAFCGWTALVQLYDFRYFSTESFFDARFQCCAFLVEYTMLLPFAGILDDKGKDTGLRILGGFFAAGAAVLVVMTVMQLMGKIPGRIASLFEWEGLRLSLMWHPNILAALFLIGLGLSLYFLIRTPRLWLKLPLGLLAAGIFVCAALTNSRASCLMLCCLLGGLVFFLVYRKRTAGRFLLGLLAAVLVIVLLFLLCMNIYDLHCSRATAGSGETVETVETDSPQASLAQDFTSFNGRTVIWQSALRALADHPQTLAVGTRQTGSFISPFNPFEVAHSHNSWMETLLCLGVVGLLFALVITFLVVKSCLSLFFFRKSTLAQKMIGLLLLALLGAEFFEPYLFYTVYPFDMINAMFLLCAGYVIYWDAAAEKLN